MTHDPALALGKISKKKELAPAMEGDLIKAVDGIPVETLEEYELVAYVPFHGGLGCLFVFCFFCLALTTIDGFGNSVVWLKE